MRERKNKTTTKFRDGYTEVVISHQDLYFLIALSEAINYMKESKQTNKILLHPSGINPRELSFYEYQP